MTSDSTQFDRSLRAAMMADAARIDTGIDLRPRVRGRMAAHNSKLSRGRLLAAASALAAVALTAGSAVAVSTGTGLIRVHRQHAPLYGVGKALNVVPPTPITTTLPDAESRAGFHVRSLSGLSSARLDQVEYHPPITQLNPKATGAVGLYYTVDGTPIGVGESLDPNGPGPMEVTLKRFDQPVPGMAKVSVETIDGSEYLVFRSASGGRVLSIAWKTTDGVLMRINSLAPQTGLDDKMVIVLIHHLS